MFNINCPYCKETLESIPESMKGQQAQCPRCQRWLTVPAFKKQDIAKPPTPKTQPQPVLLEGEKKVQTNVKQTASIGAFVCLALAIVLICLSSWSIHAVWALALFYGPLLFAAFVLSIIAMAQGRIAGGVILLLLTIIVPPVLIVAGVADELAKARDEIRTEIARADKPQKTSDRDSYNTVRQAEKATTTVHYTAGKDEFSAKQYRQVSLTTSETASATLFITTYSDSTAKIQLATDSTMFPDNTSEGFEYMEISVTYNFNNNTKANCSCWRMNIMKYHNAWYQEDSVKFILEAIDSGRLSLKLDKTGDIYRFDLEEAHQHLRKLHNIL